MTDKHVVHNAKSVAGAVFLFIGLIGVFTLLENMFHQVQVQEGLLFLSLIFVCLGILIFNLKVE